MYLDRIDRFDPEINAIVWRNDENHRAAAKLAESAVHAGRTCRRSTGTRDRSKT